ncbi:MAG: BlaI/MecI/CopY family transcriptional regulator [Gemmatimonadota bacterium]|nr:BlaI/MecI/CopY family transcriptional regulator [Gemmatimonadota bacterium]
MTETPPLPTDAELEILGVLWDRGPATVREVLGTLEDDRGYTTVLKLLQIMNEKGSVTRRREGRFHVYEAAIEREPTQRALLRDLAEKAFAGSSDALVLRALSSRGASDEELEEIRGLLAGLERGGGDSR